MLTKNGVKFDCCDIELIDLLEAAHIVPVADNGTYNPLNGIPLCTTLQNAFDASQFTFSPESLELVLAKEITVNDLGITKFSTSLKLDKNALKFRMKLFNNQI